MISGFCDEFRFLSNFFPCTVFFDGERYPSVEHEYQAAKTDDRDTRGLIRLAAHAGKAKKLGQKVVPGPNWNVVRVGIMTDLVRQKFQEPELRAALLATGESYLEETNRWGDTFWGVCNGQGENQLGRILMLVRAELQAGTAASQDSESAPL